MGCGIVHSLVSVPACPKVGSNLGRHPGGRGGGRDEQQYEDKQSDHPTIVHSQFEVPPKYKKHKEKK